MRFQAAPEQASDTMTSLSKMRRARKLASIGKMHLAYMATLDTKEYDIPDDTPEKKIDSILDEMILKDMGAHILTCPGCLPAADLKAKLREKFKI